MATVLDATQRSRPVSQRPLTEADFAALLNHLHSGPAKYELFQGELISMSPTGFHHGTQLITLGFYFSLRVRAGDGVAAGDSYLVLGRQPDHILGPDLLFVTRDQLPIRKSREGYLETIPKIVVEIRSKNDSVRELTDKIGDYLAAGVAEAWLVDPFRQLVEIHTAAGVRTFEAADTVVSSVLPEFAAPVAELIAE